MKNQKLIAVILIPVPMHHKDIFRITYIQTTVMVNIWVGGWGDCFHRACRAHSMGNVLLSACSNCKVPLPMIQSTRTHISTSIIR